MTSNQFSKPMGKAQKFVAANPLAPMADPFAGLEDDQKEFQSALSENINNRLTKAVDELKDKHSKGTNEIDDEDKAPTGYAYRAQEAEAAKRRQAAMQQKDIQRQNDVRHIKQMKENAKNILSQNKNEEDDNSENENDSDFDDDEYLNGLDDDPELEAIRMQRIDQMKKAQIQRAENLAKGHGQYRTISQDEFLPECTSSIFVACHFFHKEYNRCKIMDHHLEIIAPQHTSCKFLRIDAEKTPFFVAKLAIQTLPTLLVLRDGKVVDKMTGFQGLSLNANDPDKWHTGKLQQWLASTGAITYKIPNEEMIEEMKRLGLQPRGSVWSSEIHRANAGDFDD
eukprot:CAMPEP_0194378298 /NCGR_PEP_ID=MMETSP0174-20130528/34512_1 /TAXON_ID=216777 /ORGANISM="Proboscia alata, Strain PI-D3" /LENGTH=338 /DNA_ID=CAMNT_0039160185 /DNA_START=147 /DNA_END=1163 /DNA_ORIENTATION=+